MTLKPLSLKLTSEKQVSFDGWISPTHPSPPIPSITHFFDAVNIALDLYTGTYDKLLLAGDFTGDFNTTETESVLGEFYTLMILNSLLTTKLVLRTLRTPAVLIFSSPISLVASIIPLQSVLVYPTFIK